MPRNGLKLLRVTAALVFLVAITAALADFRNFVPARVAYGLASTQFVPSAMAFATGAGVAALAAVAILLVTLLFGRVYCSVLCPLGIFQDVISRVGGWFQRKKKLLPFAQPHTVWRQAFLWTTVVAIIAGWGGFALALLDPYSNFGRIASVLFRPLLTAANNAVVVSANAAGIQSVYRVDTPWAGAGVLVLTGLFLSFVTVMAVRRGRLYCNTVCPVGTLLGLLSRRAAFCISIDSARCHKCAKCLRSCKAQCIDLRNGTIDSSRCVACYNCISVCDDQGIGHRFSWTKKSRGTAPKPTAPSASAAKSASVEDPQRRAFLAAVATGVAASSAALSRARAESAPTANTPALVAAGEAAPAICPPGSRSADAFLSRCTSCNLCISACPTHVLQPAFLEYGLKGLLKPRLDYSASYCLFECTRCSEVCPDGALTPILAEAKQTLQIGVADLYLDRCIVQVNGTDCAACSEHCPTKAVTTRPYGDNLRIPVLDQDLCVGCGACEYACPVKPVKAIVVTGRRVHGQAKTVVEGKATAPAVSNDFPF